MECRGAVSQQVYRFLRGKGPSIPLASCFGEGNGSNNWIHGQAIAMEDWDHLASLARRDRTEGALCRISAGSELYNPDVVAYRVIALARMPPKHPGREDVRAALAAQLIFYSLTALPTPRVTTKLTVADRVTVARGDSGHFSGGVSVCLPGHRFHPSVVGQSTLGPILSWALGYSPTYPRNRIVPPLDPEEWNRRLAAANGDQAQMAQVASARQQAEDAVGNFWPLALLEIALGRQYGQSTPAEAWGLTDPTRLALRAIIESDDVASLDRVLAELVPFRLFGPLEMEVVATEGGRIARLNHAVNGMKPQLAACSLTRRGAYEAAVPSPWDRLQAALAETEDTGRSFVARADGFTVEIGYPPGAERFRVRWGGDNTPIRRVGGITSPAAGTAESPPLPPLLVPTTLGPAVTQTLATQLDSLQLSHSLLPLRGNIVRILRGSTAGLPRPAAQALALQVRTFNIGPGQAQYPVWQSILSTLAGGGP